jgi:hypothetical protein
VQDPEVAWATADVGGAQIPEAFGDGAAHALERRPVVRESPRVGPAAVQRGADRGDEALGALIVYCAAAVTMGFQVLLGTVDIGLRLILFVVLGNPSAGGAYPAPLLPGFWRAISPALPNGAGVQALRHIVYFGAFGITSNLIIIALYIATAITVAIAGTSLLARRAATGEPAAAVL